MSDTSTPPTDQEKRDALRARIEAGEQRNADRTLAEQAREVADEAIAFTRKHPLAVVGGVVVAGFAIGAMTKRGRKVGRRGGVLVNLALDTAFAYGAKMLQESLSSATAAGDRIGDFGETASVKARKLGRDAAETLRTQSRKAVDKGTKTARALKQRVGR
jgi:hypothetical protein